MKNKTCFLLLLILLSQSYLVVFAQTTSITDLYRNLSDDYFSLKIFYNEYFSIEERTRYLDEKYYDESCKCYKASYWEEDYYDGDEDENAYEPEINFTIKIDENNSHASYYFWYEGQSSRLDMLILSKKKNQYLIIIEQYLPSMGVPKSIALNYYKLDSNNKPSDKKQIALPKFKWKDFYSSEDVKFLNFDYISDIENPFLIKMKFIDEKAILDLRPDLDEFAWRAAEKKIQTSEYEAGIGQAFLDIMEFSGFGKLKTSKEKEIELLKLLK